MDTLDKRFRDKNNLKLSKSSKAMA